jgi:hypothetical protein
MSRVGVASGVTLARGVMGGVGGRPLVTVAMMGGGEGATVGSLEGEQPTAAARISMGSHQWRLRRFTGEQQAG